MSAADWRPTARRHLVVVAHNRLWWPLARRLILVIDFGDGTYCVSWRWSKKGWLVA
jgi:hypothetical protein